MIEEKQEQQKYKFIKSVCIPIVLVILIYFNNINYSIQSSEYEVIHIAKISSSVIDGDIFEVQYKNNNMIQTQKIRYRDITTNSDKTILVMHPVIDIMLPPPTLSSWTLYVQNISELS